MRSIGEFLLYGALLGASAMAVIVVAKRVQRRVKPRVWVASALGCALLVAVLGWSSRDLTQKCLSERNEGCVDAGGVGTQVVIVGAYVVFALASAFLLARD